MILADWRILLMRRLIGKLLEWFIFYEHEVIFEGLSPASFHRGDAGYDLTVSEDTIINSGGVVDIPTDIRIDPKDRIWFEIKARSSTFKYKHLEVQDAVIDRGYRGDLFAVVYNPNNQTIIVHKGERICQIVPHRLIPIRFKEGKVSKSERGNSGFGSTGI